MRGRMMSVMPAIALMLTGAGCTVATTNPQASPHVWTSPPVLSPPGSTIPSGLPSSAPAVSTTSLVTPIGTTSPVSPGTSPQAPAVPAVRTLTLGMKGPDVRRLQQRLASLHYFPGPIDGKFGQYTLEAVWAFQEVQGMPVTGRVGAATRHALAHPHAPAVLAPRGGKLRVEISLGRRVLVLYRDNKVALISHVSAGGGYYYCSPGGGCGYAITPTGNFKTTVFMPGWITVPLGTMYDSVFFIGTSYAIHGEIDVPLAPVSHGCVRIPMDIAAFFHKLVKTPGTPVYIRR